MFFFVICNCELHSRPENHRDVFLSANTDQQTASKTMGPGEKGAPRNHPEISSQKMADFECRFPYNSYGRDRAPFWPFLGEGFWQYPAAPSSPGPFVLLLNRRYCVGNVSTQIVSKVCHPRFFPPNRSGCGISLHLASAMGNRWRSAVVILVGLAKLGNEFWLLLPSPPKHFVHWRQTPQPFWILRSLSLSLRREKLWQPTGRTKHRRKI